MERRIIERRGRRTEASKQHVKNVQTTLHYFEVRGCPSSQAEVPSAFDIQFQSNIKREFAAWFADSLLEELPFPHSNELLRQGHVPNISSFLKAFTARLAYTSSCSHPKVLELVKAATPQITAVFRQRYLDPSIHSGSDLGSTAQAQNDDKVNLWLQGIQTETQNGISQRDFDRSVEFKSILGSIPYRYLVEDIKRGIILTEPPLAIFDIIVNNSLTLLGSRIEVDWDPWAFFQQQGHSESFAASIENILTLTGTAEDAQALSCGQYLSQAWPMTAPFVLALINDIIQMGSGLCILPDDTHVEAWTKDRKLIVEATGISYSIAELGQQLAWLGAALRSSVHDHELMYCKPTPRRPGHAPFRNFLILDFEYEAIDISSNRYGHCWFNLFRNPVIVKGFPIRRRHEENLGLEIPLGLMATLAEAQFLTTFGGKFAIKGFSTLLTPTRHKEDFVVWHLLCNKNQDRISYTDSRLLEIPGLYPHTLDPGVLDVSRHILGWCSIATDLTGSHEANYDIKWAGLHKENRDNENEHLSIARGKLISPKPDTFIGTKDRASHIPSNVYVMQLRWIAKQHVVLHDVQDRRAWLVDGASALLHLVRASLKEDENDDLGDLFGFKSLNLEEATNEVTGKRAAIAVLLNERNRGLGLCVQGRINREQRPASNYSGDNFDSRPREPILQDRVNQIYHLLEQVIDQQIQVNLERTEYTIGSNRAQVLEGYNFMDVATDEDHFWRRTIELQQEGDTWVGLTSAINSITLFGRGFGDLIKPACLDGLCAPWFTVPKGKDYLCVSTSHMAEIIRKKGSLDTNPWTVVDDIVWHAAGHTFEPCSCAADTTGKCNRVQILVSYKNHSTQKLALKSPSRLEEHGAIIFGSDLGLSLNQSRSSGRRTRTSILKETRSSSVDSGIGSSIRSTGSGGRTSSGISENTAPSSGTELTGASSNSNSWWASLTNLTTKVPFSYKGNWAKIGKPEGPASEVPGFEKDPVIHAPSSTSRVNNTMKLIYSAPEPSKMLTDADYTIGWICALKDELHAAIQMLDEYYQKGFGHGPDNNLYILGRIGAHNVVIVCLPMGRYGNSAAAMVATRMMAKYPSIKIGLMVGIGGGLPSDENDIRLGDVIVSKPCGRHGGVVQYDMGKHRNDGFECTGWLNSPPELLLAVLNILPPHGATLEYSVAADYPGERFDTLYSPTYQHKGGASCTDCDSLQAITRSPGNRETGPCVFYGTIASGNAVIRDAATRHELQEQHGALCFEMEAAGLISSNFPCLVIRGVSDYADSHKNDLWKEYAAMTAAQYAKELICAVPDTI